MPLHYRTCLFLSLLCLLAAPVRAQEGQRSAIGRFFHELFPFKSKEQKQLRKDIKKALDNEDGLRLPENRVTEKTLLWMPVSYYSIYADFYVQCTPDPRSTDCLNDGSCSIDNIRNAEKAFIFFKRADILLNGRGMKAKLDEDLALDIADKYLVKKLGEEYAGMAGFRRWVGENVRRLERCFRERQETYRSILDKQMADKEQIVSRIRKLNGEVDSLASAIRQEESVVRQRSKRIEGLTRKNFEPAMRARERLEERLRADDEGTFALAGDAQMVVSNGRQVVSPEMRGDMAEYRLGDHCSDEIVGYVRKLARLLVNEKKDALSDPKAQRFIRISVTVTGHSDGYGFSAYGQTATIAYRGASLPSQTYHAVREAEIRGRKAVEEFKTVSKSFNNGDKISNLDLAFLRAYCAKLQIDEALADEGLGHLPTGYRYRAFEHEEKDEDGAFRSVSFDMAFEGLYEHKKLEIDQMRKQMREKQVEIEELKERRETVEAEIRRLMRKLNYDEKLLTEVSVDRVRCSKRAYEALSKKSRKKIQKGKRSLKDACREENVPLDCD